MSVAVHIAAAADAGYVPHCAVMMRSVLAQHPGAYLHFLHAPNLAEQDLQSLGADIEAAGGHLQSHEIPDAWVESLAVMERIPAVMWYRVFLPELLPELDRILYLDCDTLVVDSLAPLWALNMDGQLLGAVDNIFESGMEFRLSALGIPREQSYFNSGVLLLNLAEWRRQKTAAQLVDFAREQADHLLWPDQDALNVVTGSRRVRLAPRWNAQNSMHFFAHAATAMGHEARDAAVHEPAIVHFEGPGFCKPWHILCRHPRRQYYRALRRESAWARFRLQGAERPHYHLLRCLPMSWIMAILGAPDTLRRWRRAASKTARSWLRRMR